MVTGTAIPQYVIPLFGVDVLVVLFTSSSTSWLVVEESAIAPGLVYASDEEENLCSNSGIVEVDSSWLVNRCFYGDRNIRVILLKICFCYQPND